MESIPPEKIFLEWKDEEMLAWDSLIYNTKLSSRHIIATQPKSVDSIIHDFKFNFGIDVTIKDLEERSYLTEFFDYEHQRLCPSDEDLRKLLFYDINTLKRISLATGIEIMEAIFYYLKGIKPETDLKALSYETPRNMTISEMLDSFQTGSMNSSNTVHVNSYEEAVDIFFDKFWKLKSGVSDVDTLLTVALSLLGAKLGLKKMKEEDSFASNLKKMDKFEDDAGEYIDITLDYVVRIQSKASEQSEALDS